MDRQEFAKRLQAVVIPEGTLQEDIVAMTRPLSEAIGELLPRRLFRYRSFKDYTVDAFERDVIFALTADQFNDPYDTLVRYDLKGIEDGVNAVMSREWLEQQREWFAQGNDYPESIKQAMPQGMPEALRERIVGIDDFRPFENRIAESRRVMISLIETYFPILAEMAKQYSTIACFSESIQSMLMWSHYADSHKGFALEYDFRPLLKNPIKNVGLFPVIYSDERLDISSYVAWEFLHLLGYITPSPDISSYIKTALYKSSVWSYEKEWRMIDSSFRENSSAKVSAILYKPVAIYYGQNMPREQKEILHRIAREKRISEYEMYIDYSSALYEMRFRPV